MEVLHIVGKVGKSSFGLGEVALNLALHQIKYHCRSRIWCLQSTLPDAHASGLGPDGVKNFRAFGPKPLFYTPQMESAARYGASETGPMVVHQHGIWTALSRVTTVWRKKHKLPAVVAAHGALQPWALRKSHWKKALASFAYEWDNLNQASCLHACGDTEIEDYRGYSLKNPIALLPNGISSDWSREFTDAESFRRRHSIPADTRILLYLSRITPKKGLGMLLKPLHELRNAFKDWVFVIAGSDEFNYLIELKTEIEKLSLSGKVRFIGPIYGVEKRSAYASADLFVLPTHSEGNPIVVLEALGAGVPVLTTKGTPWSDLTRHDCGWWTDISAESLGDALNQALSKSNADLREMGCRGRALVQQKYEWSIIANKTIRLYDWLIKGGTHPDFVHLF
jgi:glycosyltransferase involved in cell wall biosynthesis